MTLAQIRNAIWKAIGEPNDIDPSNDSTELTRVANLGQLRVFHWKDPVRGRQNRFPSMIGDLNFKSSVLTDTILTVNNSTSPYYLDLTSLDQNDDQYNDWVVKCTSGDANGEIRYVTDYDGTNRRIYLDNDFASDPAIADTVALYKRFSYLMPSSHAWVADHISLPASSDSTRSTGNLVEVLKIEDIKNNKVLKKSLHSESYPGNVYSLGDATEWYRKGNKIYFNYNILDDDEWFHMEYYRTPTNMSADDSEPELPEQYHYAIVIWGIIYYFREGMEAGNKYSEELDFDKYMRSIIGPQDVGSYRDSKQLRVNY